MTYATRARGTLHRLTSHFGGGRTITLRRSHSLFNGRTSAAVTALAVRGTTAAGAAVINLDQTDLDAGGVLPVGLTFTVAGDATVYTVATADVRVGSSGRLDSVAFTPVLAAEAADDAVVTLATAYVDYTLPFAQSDYMAEDVAAGVDRTDLKVIVSGLGAPATFNVETDAALIGTQALTVKSVKPYQPDGVTTAGLILQVAA